MSCASVIFPLNSAARESVPLPKVRREGGRVLAMRLTIAFVNLVLNTVPNLKPAARASLEV